jgi:ketol-acid reductoisomerase
MNNIAWDIYEITTKKTEIHGVMLRGRIRKLGIENGFNVLCENATDVEKCVRFAVITPEDAEKVSDYVKSIIPDVRVAQVLKHVINPVLSKLKVNIEDRYTL